MEYGPPLGIYLNAGKTELLMGKHGSYEAAYSFFENPDQFRAVDTENGTRPDLLFVGIQERVNSGPNPEARPKSGESIFIKRGGAHASSTRSSWRHLPTGSVHEYFT